MDFSKIEIYKYFFSQVGREEIISEIQRFKAEHGKNWLKEFKRDFPDLVVIIDLVANYNANDALLKFKEFIAGEIDSQMNSIFTRIAAKAAAFGFLDTNKQDVFKLHADLKAEIDKPRF
jgi:hypothetical protein